MIFYFTGTGNSLQVAKNIAQHTNERLISISHCGKNEFTLEQNEIIGFVYPVYAWAPPKIVLQFIKNLKISNYDNNYVFSVVTCGDNIGNTMKLVKRNLKKAGLPLHSGFSVQMPNNYIFMYDVDSKELETRKLSAADKTLERINKVIKDRTESIFEVVKGSFPGALTSIINPLFNKFALRTEKFYATDKCTGCGICQKVCNCDNIRVDGKPSWGKSCSQCLACIHYCPVKAVQYGSKTLKKGRYTNPNIKIEEIIS